MSIVFTILWDKFAAGMRTQMIYKARTYLLWSFVALAIAAMTALFIPFVRTTPAIYLPLVLWSVSGFCMLFGLIYVLIAYEKKGWVAGIFSLILLFWLRGFAVPMFDSEFGDAILVSFFTGFMLGWVAIILMHYRFAKLVSSSN